MKPSSYICDSMRDNRPVRKMRARGIVIATWRGCPRRMFKRMGCFISLDGAADCRKAGRYHLARQSLARAVQDHHAWVAAGGYIP